MHGTTTPQLPWPGLAVAITADRLEARVVSSEHAARSAQPVGRLEVLEHITRAGIIYGIDDQAIDQLTAALAAGAHLAEPLLVARGVPPASTRFDLPELLVAAVTNPETVQSLRLAAPLHYQEMAHIAGWPEPARVDPGQPLVRLSRMVEAKPGMTVDGAPLEPGPPVLALVPGRGVTFEPDTMTIAATGSGVVLCDGKVVEVLPLAYDARAEVSIAPDGMKCTVTLMAGGPGGTPLTAETALSELARAGVVMGILPAEMDVAVADACRDGTAARDVALGCLPQHGTDARLEYLVDLDPAPVPMAEEHGRVDFKSINVIRSVCAGQPLVRRHPATKGVPGFTVTGQSLSANPGREVRLPRGRNTMPDPADPDLLRAAVDGNVRTSGGDVEVSECLVIKGDVDYSTGHIKYARSVIVKGDVKSGFNVEVGGDLEIAGLAEDCVIRAGGSVLIRHGFVGQGHGRLEAGGRVLLGFGRNQTVRCSGGLNVEREAINMNLSSRDAVIVGGPLVGGRVTARSRIVCRVLGNAGSTRTELEVGVVDQALLEQRAQITERIRQLRSTLAAGGVPDRPGQARSDSPGTGQPPPAEEVFAAIDSLEEELKGVLAQLDAAERARVVVQDTVWPGTQVKIYNSPVLKTADRLPGPLTFALREGVVRWA